MTSLLRYKVAILRYKAARIPFCCALFPSFQFYHNWYITACLVYNTCWFLNCIHVGSTELNKPFICSIKQGN